jgi:hypothetical protein
MMIQTSWFIAICFTAIWTIIGKSCKLTFSCPKDLDPKNNEGKKTKKYYDYYGNYPSIIHAISSVLLGLFGILNEGATFG